MFQHNLTRSWSRTGETISQAVAVQAEQEVNLDLSVADGASNQLVAMSLDVSQVKSVYILSDQALTLETNDGTTPDATITLAANTPVLWIFGDAAANPFGTDDVTALYVTNASGEDATLKVRILVDPTV